MPTNAPHSGPGRASSRSRAAARPSSRQSARAERAPRGRRRLSRPDQPVSSAAPAQSVAARFSSRSIGVTRRAIAFMVVIAILVLSYASSMRVYLRQERELATAQQQIAQRTAANADLQYEIDRWKDANYVKSQARQRLGWVVPGEIGYRVVDANGNPVSGSTTITSSSALPAGEHPTTWWERLSGSLTASDAPLVQATETPGTVTVSSSPTSTPSATPTKK